MPLTLISQLDNLHTGTVGSLLLVGVLFGLINTLSGGGSILTLPALMMLGLDPHSANATNRVGGVLQTLSAAIGFWKRGAFEDQSVRFLLGYAMIGGTLGPWVSLQLDQSTMVIVIQSCLLTIALFTILAPKRMFQDPSPAPKSLIVQHCAAFVVSFYGGFLQAGIGLVSLYLLRFICGYDLVRGTAIKSLYLCVLTLPTLVVFIWFGQVRWIYGLILAFGSIIGAHFGVRVSLSPKGNEMIRAALPFTAILMMMSLMIRSQ